MSDRSFLRLFSGLSLGLSLAAATLVFGPLIGLNVSGAYAQTDEALPENESSIVEIAPPPASAAWREDIGTLRVGVAAGDDARGTVRRMELFRESLADKLDLPVEIVPFGDLLTLSDAQASGRIEYAIHSALSYATTSAVCNCVEPLAVPTFSGGAKSLRVIAIVSGNSTGNVSGGIMATGPGAKAKLGVIGSPASNVHLDFARALLEQAGELPAAFADGAVVAFDDASAAANALASNEIGGILGWSTLTGALADGYSHGTLRSLVQTGALPVGQLELAWQSPEIMLGPHAIRRNLPAELKGLLQGHLLALEGSTPAAYDSVSPDLAGGFRPVQPSDYSVVKGLLTSGETPNVPNQLFTEDSLR